MEKVFLIDANAVAYRSFFAIKDLATSYGQPTNAVYGFINTLNKIIRETEPDYLVCAFDAPGETFRHKIFAEYKLQRPGMPEGLISQLPLIKEVLSAYRIPVVEQSGFEADDILYSLAEKGKEKGIAVYIVTADKDLLQLVSDVIKVFHPQTYETIDLQKVVEKFGVTPERIPDLMALIGDSTDNIPGVKGIGEKTGVPLIQRFGSLENLYQHLAEVPGEGLRRKLEEGRETAFLSKRLATLSPSPLSSEGRGAIHGARGSDESDPYWEEFRLQEPDKKKLAELFRRLEFRKMLKEVEPEGSPDYFLLVPGGKIVFEDILKDPSAFTPALSSDRVLKAGTDLKEKLKILPPGLAISGPFFDFGVAASLCEKQASSGEPEETLQFYRKELKNLGLQKLFEEVEMPLLPILTEMEKTGVYLDVPYLENLRCHFTEVLQELESKIFQLAGKPFNINSPRQLAIILFEELKLPFVKKTKTGFSTDSSVLDALAPLHPVIPLILNYRQIAKLNSTYVDTLPAMVDPKDGRLHTIFNPVGAVTGRLSSEKPNLQNIPVETPEGGSIRRAFCRQKQGDILCAFDYSQIELRILAHLSEDPALIQAFQEDRDIHTETARALFRKGRGSIHRACGSDESDPYISRVGVNDVSAAERRAAKIVNFGIIYGMSAFGLSRQLGISPEEAQHFINTYFQQYAGVKEFITQTLDFARDKGYVTTILGRRRSIPEIKNKRSQERMSAERTAVNTPVQGSAADVIKSAMVKCASLLTTRNLNSKMLLQIHDELLFESPETEREVLVPLVKEAMETAVPLSISLKVDAKSGINWQDLTKI
ncbi:MAG: DNA polymerase I [Candidatus Omnitrophota bacterium]